MRSPVAGSTLVGALGLVTMGCGGSGTATSAPAATPAPRTSAAPPGVIGPVTETFADEPLVLYTRGPRDAGFRFRTYVRTRAALVEPRREYTVAVDGGSGDQFGVSTVSRLGHCYAYDTDSVTAHVAELQRPRPGQRVSVELSGNHKQAVFRGAAVLRHLPFGEYGSAAGQRRHLPGCFPTVGALGG